MKKILLLTCLMYGNVLLSNADNISIIPKPVDIIQNDGFFRLTENVTIGYEPECKPQAEFLQNLLNQSTGWNIKILESSRKATIQLSISPKKVSRTEGYNLDVTPDKVYICGADNAGVFYGIQTFLQLLPAEVYSEKCQRNIDWKAPSVKVNDAPERPWRGMMLDVARYFYDKEFVKKYIDMMAMYKLNKLQFHLIDDSGWRLEIKKYPRLTEVGAWAGKNGHRLGGYYTQEDIKELIEYGKVRNVEIIPEIEFPAHMLSAIVAYPWLSCTGKQHELPDRHFISRDLICVGKESSYQFLRDVLEETVNLFPSSYINIGGDEAVYSRWEECPKCQEVMKREGLKKVSELQGYLTNVVSDMMKEKKRTIVGWEEIIQRGKLNNQVVALMWHNVNDTIQATRTGHKSVLTPATHMYFDFPESSTPGEIKAATWMPPISLEKCYSMELNDYSSSSTVLGVQGCFWSDQFIHGTVLQEFGILDENRSENYAEYLTFPRLLALSEVAWNKMSSRNYNDFKRRIGSHYRKLDFKKCHYRVPEPEIVSMEKDSDGRFVFTLKPSVDGSKIVYTTNGQYPTIHSAEYKDPVIVDDKSDFHAMTVVNDRKYSLPIYFAPDYSKYKEYGVFTWLWTPMQIQTNMQPMRFECTGKISGNGSYEITFIKTKGKDDLNINGMKLWKRDELLFEVKDNGVLTSDNSTFTFKVNIDSFEAGTPFFIDLVACGNKGNDVSGLVFIRKK